MKIAVNTRFLIKDKLEGVGWFTFEVVKRLVNRHPEHEFLFFFDRQYDEEFIFGKNVTPVVLSPPARHPVLWYLWFEFSVRKALKKYKPDVFLSPDGYLSMNTDVKTVIVIHDLAYLHFPKRMPFLAKNYYRIFMPKFLKKADKILTVSNYSKNDIIKNFKINPEKIQITGNGCRKNFKPLDEVQKDAVRKEYSGGKQYFFYVGAVQPRKNIHRLINAFDVFKSSVNSDMKLLIGGRFAWQTGEVKSAWDSAKYKNDIKFLGYISDAELPDIMASAYALTYISLFEGFGIPLLEAMNCNIPVITADVSSMPEVVEDAGLTVNPKSIEEISDAMIHLYNDKELYKSLIKKGIRQSEKFTWDKATGIVWEAIISVHKL